MPETDNVENKMPEETVIDEKNGRVYELGYLLVPTISEEVAPSVFGNLKELVSSLGGEIIASEMPRMIHLAYVMTKVIENVKVKYDSAYFGWIKFEMDTEKLVELKKQLDLNPDLIRFLITKTVKESTLAPKKFAGGGGSRFRNGVGRREEKKEEAPIDKEEIDKEIDAMVETAV